MMPQWIALDPNAYRHSGWCPPANADFTAADASVPVLQAEIDDYGRGGTDCFQICSLEMDGRDVTDQVDQGMHLGDKEDLRNYLAEVFELSVSEIDLECVGWDDNSDD